MGWRGVGEVFYCPMTRSQSFSGRMILDCKFHKCFLVCLVFFLPQVGQDG